MTRCGACGYPVEYHESAGHCPLCACGKLPGEHLPVAEPAAPLIEWTGKQLLVCPGKPLTAAGKLPTLRRGSFRPPDAPRAYERRAAWGDILFEVREPEPAPEALSEPQAPPQVPGRYTTSLGEIAPRAMPLGKQAAALGWQVDPHYYRSSDGTEASVLLMRRGDLRAWATWERPPGATWKTAGAHAWPPGQFPVAVGVKRLLEIIIELG